MRRLNPHLTNDVKEGRKSMVKAEKEGKITLIAYAYSGGSDSYVSACLFI